MTRQLLAPDFLALTIGIVVFFVGVLITQRAKILRRYSYKHGQCIVRSRTRATA